MEVLGLASRPGEDGGNEGSRAGEEGFLGSGGHASGRAGDAEELPSPALVEVVLGDGLRVGGVELRGLIEVVGEALLGGLGECAKKCVNGHGVGFAKRKGIPHGRRGRV